MPDSKDALVLLFRKGEEDPASIYGPMTGKEADAAGSHLVNLFPKMRVLITTLSPGPHITPAAPRDYDPVLEAELERVMVALPYRIKFCLGREALAGYAMALAEKMDCFTLGQLPYPERYQALLEHISRALPVRDDATPRR